MANPGLNYSIENIHLIFSLQNPLYDFQRESNNLVSWFQLDRFENVLISCPPLAVRVFVCRCLANCVSHPVARDSVIDRMPVFISLIAPSLTENAKQMQVSKHCWGASITYGYGWVTFDGIQIKIDVSITTDDVNCRIIIISVLVLFMCWCAIQLAASACICNFSLVLLQRSEQDKVHEVSIREDAAKALMNSMRKIDSFSHLDHAALRLCLQVGLYKYAVFMQFGRLSYIFCFVRVYQRVINSWYHTNMQQCFA